MSMLIAPVNKDDEVFWGVFEVVEGNWQLNDVCYDSLGKVGVYGDGNTGLPVYSSREAAEETMRDLAKQKPDAEYYLRECVVCTLLPADEE